jgi:hypothetical protein
LVVIPLRGQPTGSVTRQEYNIETDCTGIVYENVNCVEWNHDSVHTQVLVSAVLNLLRGRFIMMKLQFVK